jgi:hypothetical protein
MDHNGIDLNLLHIKHKFLDLLKTTMSFSPSNKNKTTAIKAQQNGFYDEFITIIFFYKSNKVN